jgi:hypothetical protein
METPNYKHDCEQCSFIGTDRDDSLGSVDMYCCSQNGFPTIVMRYGDLGEEYTSAPVSVINSNIAIFGETPMLRNMLIAEDMKLWNRWEIKK